MIAYRGADAHRVSAAWIDFPQDPGGGQQRSDCALQRANVIVSTSTNMTSWTTATLDRFNVGGMNGSVTGDPWFAANPVTKEAYLVTESRDNYNWTGNNETTFWRSGANGTTWTRGAVCSGVGRDFQIDKPSIAFGPAGIIPGTSKGIVYVADLVVDDNAQTATEIHLHYRKEEDLNNTGDWARAQPLTDGVSAAVQGPVVLAHPTNGRVYLLWVNWTNGAIRAAELRTGAGGLYLERIGEYLSPAGRNFVFGQYAVPDLNLHSASMPMAAINPFDGSIGVVWHDWDGSRMTVRFSRFQPPAAGATNGSFSTPVAINDGSDHQFTPAIAANDNGNYIVTYFASHRNQGVIDGYETRASFVNSTGGPLSTPAQSLSNNVSASPWSCLPALGEYQAVAYSEGHFYAASIQATAAGPPYYGERTYAIVADVTLPACNSPSVTLPADRTIPSGTPTTINGSATGDPTLQYQWYTVSGGVQTLIGGETSSSLTVTPPGTTTYRLIVTNSCGSGSDDILVTVTGTTPPTTPVMIGATYNPATGFNEVSWQASSSAAGLNRYVIERMPDGQIMNADPQYTTIYDAYNVIAGRTYAYRVKAVDNNNVESSYSARDIATRMVFIDDPIRAPNDNGGTFVRGVHVAELRRAVDAVRYAAGLAPAWSDYNNLTGTVFATQFTELRTRLNEARTALGITSVVFSDPVSATQMIVGRPVKELRDGVK